MSALQGYCHEDEIRSTAEPGYRGLSKCRSYLQRYARHDPGTARRKARRAERNPWRPASFSKCPSSLRPISIKRGVSSVDDSPLAAGVAAGGAVSLGGTAAGSLGGLVLPAVLTLGVCPAGTRRIGDRWRRGRPRLRVAARRRICGRGLVGGRWRRIIRGRRVIGRRRVIWVWVRRVKISGETDRHAEPKPDKDTRLGRPRNR